MPVEIFDSLDKIKTRFAGAPFLSTHPRRAKALEQYFSRRGIVQLDTDAKPNHWPALRYPHREKLSAQIDELTLKHRDHTSKKWHWQMTHLKASSKEMVAHAQKVTDPLYWKHLAKSVTDSQYRDDARAIDLHASLISDKKYRPMIDAFVNNEEYRKQLTETVKTSIVYKDHKGLAKHAGDRKKLQMDVSKSLVEKTHIQVVDAQEQLFALKELLKWSQEK
jgi:hypothetical protein